MQTAVPKPDFMAMTPATLHARSAPAAKPSPSPSPTPKKPHHTPDGWYIPVISLVAPDLTSAGTRQFFTSTSDIPGLLTTAVLEVVKQLYTTPANQPQLPETIALHVRPMRGVAYTTGDAAHKEIHLSADYVGGLEAGAAAAREIEGVVLHEMVHVWQCDGGGTAPGGLVEGLADWVRLRGGYAPEHWSRGGEAWDDGYHITAYFLDWLEDVYGPGTVVWINAQLRGRKYDPGMWELLSGGRDVDALWESYAEFYSIGGSKRRTKPSKPSKPVHEPAAAASAMTVPLVAVYHAAPPPDRATFTVTQETEVVAQGPDSVESLPDTMEPYDPFAFGGETALVEIFRQRLAELRFDGTKDGKRFVKEFEGLVQRVVPGISEEDRRLLLVTCFVGDVVNSWYEETDLDDDFPYGLLAEKLQDRFKGKSMRKMQLIDRDAKLS